MLAARAQTLSLFLGAALALSFSSCVSGIAVATTGDAWSFLYRTKPTLHPAAIPTLRLPLRVAWRIPAGSSDGRGGYRHVRANFSEQQTDLMGEVAAVQDAVFRQSIELIRPPAARRWF